LIIEAFIGLKIVYKQLLSLISYSSEVV